MPAYRQTAHPSYQPHATRPHTAKYFSGQKQQSVPKPAPAATLAVLIGQFEANTIRISCNRKLSVIIQKNAGKRHSALISDRKRRRKIGIVTGGGSRGTLQSCLEKYTSEADAEYIVTSTLQHGYQHLQSRGKSISAKSRTSSETSIGQPRSSKKISQKPVFSNRFFEAPEALQGYASEKKMGDQQMFVVEQNAGESIQSERESLPKRQSLVQVRESQQEALKQEIKNNFSNITTKYLQKMGENQPLQRERTNAEPKLTLNQNQQSSAQKQNVNEANKNTVLLQNKPLENGWLIDRDRIENQKFSFAEAMIGKGVILQESIKLREDSFKLAEGQVDAQKNPAKEMEIPASDMSSLTDLSSILGSHLREETKNKMELDSIKNQIEKISSCLPHPAPPKPQEQIIEIKLISDQPEINVNDFVQISQKTLEANRSEYYVRYNLEERKGPKTDVIRISPLKFRRKEEVVRQFVKAKIVSKQSDSINIP